MSYDKNLDEQIREHAKNLYAQNGKLYEIMDGVRNIFLCQWTGEASFKQEAGDKIKATRSPDGRNAVLGATRLLTYTLPQITVPKDKNEPEVVEIADKLEKASIMLWNDVNRVRNRRLEWDIVLSALLCGTTHIAVESTKDLVEYSKRLSPAYKARAKKIAKAVPCTFNVLNPRTAAVEMDSFGLRTYCREVITTRAEVERIYGDRALPLFKASNKELKPYSEVTLNLFWDMETHQAWIHGEEGKVILQEAHGLPFIPVDVRLIEGSSALFSEPEYQATPFLYTVFQTEMYQRVCLAQSILFTLAYAFANPQIMNMLNAEGVGAEVDFSVPAGIWNVPHGADVKPFSKGGFIDPLLLQIFDLASGKMTESTILKQALGQPIGGGAAYSAEVLYNQAGRLPIVPYQRAASQAIGGAIKMAFQLMRFEKRSFEKYGLAWDEIPEDFELEVKLESVLPYERLQMASVVTPLKQSGITSTEWLRDNILNIGQSDDMDWTIWGEQAGQAGFQQRLMQFLQSAMPPQPGAPPPQGETNLTGGGAIPGSSPPGALSPENLMGASAGLQAETGIHSAAPPVSPLTPTGGLPGQGGG